MDEEKYSNKMDKEDMDAYYSLAISTSDEETSKALEDEASLN